MKLGSTDRLRSPLMRMQRLGSVAAAAALVAATMAAVTGCVRLSDESDNLDAGLPTEKSGSGGEPTNLPVATPSASGAGGTSSPSTPPPITSGTPSSGGAPSVEPPAAGGSSPTAIGGSGNQNPQLPLTTAEGLDGARIISSCEAPDYFGEELRTTCTNVVDR